MDAKTIDRSANFDEVIKKFELYPHGLFKINTGGQIIQIKVINIKKMDGKFLKSTKKSTNNCIESSFGGWKELVDCKKLKKEIYSSRKLKTNRPIPKFESI